MTHQPIPSMMVGSMPYQTPEEAIAVIKQHPPTIPTFPQLPKRSFKEGMVPQYSEGFPGITINENDKKIWVQNDEELLNLMANFYEQFLAGDIASFTISPEFGAGFPHFLDLINESQGKVPVAKAQATGPFTFGLGLNDQNGKAVWFDPQYRDIVVKGITAKAKWVVSSMSPFAEKIVICLDEPILSALGTAAYLSVKDEDVITYLNEVADELHAAGATVGVHCCGNMDWGLLSRTTIDFISFDAYFYGERLALYPKEINNFLERGGRLAWGIVPTAESEKIHSETPEGLLQKMESLIQEFRRKGIGEDMARKQMIITPSCGLGFLTPDEAVKVLQLMEGLTRLVNEN